MKGRLTDGHHLKTLNREELINRCLNNDRDAQFALYQQFQVAMFGICARYAASNEEAQDILQEGFIKVFRDLGSLKDAAALPAWIKRVMVNTALEHLRRYQNRHIRANDLEGSEQATGDYIPVEADLAASELTRLIQELPAGLRAVFNLYAIEGYSHQEISAQLGISESNSKVRLSRARKVLQGKVEQIFETN